MSDENTPRESWATRLGFILAAVGSAVGLGNIWRFPFQTGQQGGAAFLVVYLAFVAIIGLPAILVEFVVGRRTKQGAFGALAEFGGGGWGYLGGLFVVIGFVILSYYGVVAGWVLRYLVASPTGAYMTEPAAYFGTIASGPGAVLFHAVFMAAVVAVVALGVQNGIELAVKVMVPAIVVLVAGLAAYAATLPEAGAAYAYYLSPEPGVLAANWRDILPAAAGQAFFTLSLGMGVMITYASYIGEDRNLGVDGAAVVGLNTGISVVVGLIVFPILFAAGVDPADPGAGVIFVSMAGAFAALPVGRLLGTLFFGTVALAALSSAISLMEVVVSAVIDEWGTGRRSATVGAGVAMFLVGVPATLSPVIVTLYDKLAANVLLVVGGLALVVLVGWRKSGEAVDELGRGVGALGASGPVWIWLVRVPILLVLLVSLVLGVQGYAEFLLTEFAGFLSG